LDKLDGWGTYQSITVGFDRPLDLQNIVRRHQGDDYEPADDVAYLLDVTPDSPDFCERTPLDFGEGNFPTVLERKAYFDNDRDSEQLSFEDRDEDANRNGVLDLGEDLDMDGVLDAPNVLVPGQTKFQTMEWYERETNTLIMKPLMPLRENTTYAVVLTRRLVDEDGRPVRSPFAYVNHTSQTQQLAPLGQCLPKYGLGLDDVAFTWAYSTMSVSRDFRVIRDGLYGLGPLSRLSTQFPAELKGLLQLRESSVPNSRIVPSEALRAALPDILKALNRGRLSKADEALIDAHKFVDFHAVFSFESPQFFRRVDSEDRPLPLYKQTFELDPVSGAAFTRPERSFVWLTVPKNRRGPAPVVILGHGYTGNKLDPLIYGGFFARLGLACIGVENVSHGIDAESTEIQALGGLFKARGLENFFTALTKNDRAFDQNGDGRKDSAADFWTSYISHTREVVRQSAVDYMQLVRILKTFDGATRWEWDVNRDGAKDLAGDFDGDGQVDVGGVGSINITGGSLGGIMSALMAGLEPQMDVAIPVAGGAGLPDIGVRSIQGGVREAVNLRMLGPLLVTIPSRDDATKRELWTVLPDLNGQGRRRIAAVPVPLVEGDTVVLHNLTTKEHRCFRMGADGLSRAAISSDQYDGYRYEIYPGVLPPKPREGCEIPAEASPKWVLERFEFDFTWQGRPFKAGDALVALGDGFGFRRNSPEIRRFMGLAQLAIERGDPVNYLPNAERHRILRYGTGEEVSTRLLVVNTIGDMNVPVAAGASIARAAGFIGLTEKDPRYGKTQNRVLIDTGVIKAVERDLPYRNSKGEPVLLDVDHWSAVNGVDDGFDVPRLNPPLRLVKRSERVGGFTGVIFPMVVPTGKHGFDPPNPERPWDLGSFLMNLLGRYIASGGSEFPVEPCVMQNACSWIPPVPND
ncbi:MAG: hypothetical protein INH41_03645, partial [Myxococcaceae bacterium]|nr:hypothetical protein [Myxococcaceae bacterium]